MVDPAPYELVGRLAVAAFVMIAPSLCFLGLVRGLERLRDDALILEWAQNRSGDPEYELPTESDVLAALATDIGTEPGDTSAVRCPICSARNRTEVTYCNGCLHRLE
ncbi:DUF7577 domain-containing protein [Natrinema caseinilyticum]|uniref:DUF7577 domain-containing protein n=1 Tax=Natrinema caseinilyticum TaxID=2961570 RepID=UPI0020C494FC|nr:zinc ribbon domain-containing protein [Natrinema caseinilyticum]